ncbi:hypothetical protein [Sediminibacillus halophilus]|uniref:Uncharacterized protein n=1 Tax=Sediminibacillus halophilus TaxID=482461 RepID=A0A1G9T538_9BACI|nr:hypothetical protein [Sediminibacillus halophilus]SDM42742.1 hypothetical protein SAMN05216244_2437 [Sediminibacillus halophilus]
MNPLKRDSLDVTKFEASTCTDKNRSVRKGGVTVVYSDNGKRLSLNTSILEQLSDLTSVQIAYSDKLIAIANYLGESNTNYALKKNGKSNAIYNAVLVKEIIERYNLDYSNRTSLTFPVYKVQETDKGKVVYIDMNPSTD